MLYLTPPWRLCSKLSKCQQLAKSNSEPRIHFSSKMADYLNQIVQEDDIHLIVNALIARSYCVQRKDMLVGALRLPSSVGVELEQKWRMDGCNSYNYFKGLISQWILLKGTKATAIELDRSLTSIQWIAAAEDFRKIWAGQRNNQPGGSAPISANELWQQQQRFIQVNLDTLCKFIDDWPRLKILLLQNELLSEGWIQKLDAIPDEPTRYFQMLTTVRKKTAFWEKLKESFQNSGHSDAMALMNTFVIKKD